MNEEIQNVRLIQQENTKYNPNINRTTSQHNQSFRRIRYFSMFTGVGGFEQGFERVNNLRPIEQQDSKGSGSNNNLKNESLERECTDIPETERNEQGWNERDSADIEQISLPPKQFACVGFSEIDKYASQLLAAKWPGIKNYGDARKINPGELPDFDMLCGGFPCQAFSIAGKRRGFEDTRGTMFFEIARIVKIKRPKIVLLENVKGLLNHNKGETFRVIIQTLSELGYDVQWMVCNSKFFGVPQNRERVFIIGSLRGQPRPEILPFRKSGEINNESDGQGNETAYCLNQGDKHRGSYITYPTLSTELAHSTGRDFFRSGGKRIMEAEIQRKAQIIEDFYPDRIREFSESPTIRGDRQGLKVAIPVLTPDRENKRQNGRRFKEDGEPSFTLTKTDIHGVSDGMKIRRLTPMECERLQGFPDNWTERFSDTQRYKQMGNAVTVNVVQAIAEKLLKWA